MIIAKLETSRVVQRITQDPSQVRINRKNLRHKYHNNSYIIISIPIAFTLSSIRRA